MIRSKGYCGPKEGNPTWIYIRRFKCGNCHIHRELPENIDPYKQYEHEIISGVLDGFITPDTLGYEDYPCQVTMERWVRTRELQLLI